jgi:FtsP/CotA-like multicopper oxidase with cupredoxin domain
MNENGLSRRNFLRFGLPASLGLAGTAALAARRADGPPPAPGGQSVHGEHARLAQAPAPYRGHPMPGPTGPPAGTLQADRQKMNPMKVLTAFDYGKVSKLPNGRTLREYELTAIDIEQEVAPGMKIPVWTVNGYVPGPTIRCTEGDLLRIHFRNEGKHFHTIHLHGIHPANMDGVFEMVPPGGKFTYELTAEPFGLFLYHCHVMPLTKHIEKGMYGTFVVDPPRPRPPAREFVMVMNGYDTDLDGKNDLYTVNGVANYFVDHPIEIRQHEPVRIYLVNLLERDMINSFHIHANVFRLYRTGTSLTHSELTDVVIMGQGERAVIEFSYKFPGRYMFHAHKTEFSELGWMGFFDVKPIDAKA